MFKVATGHLCQAVYQTAREITGAAQSAGDRPIPGMVAVVQTFGDDLS
jgi:hypothetical protein